MANLGFPQFINFLLQPVPCLLISKLILTFAQFANFYPLFAQFVMCGLQILPTFSSFCLDVIFSTSSWPSFTATSRDLEIFRCLFQRSFALLQSFYGNFSLKMRVCLVTPLSLPGHKRSSVLLEAIVLQSNFETYQNQIKYHFCTMEPELYAWHCTFFQSGF